MTDIVEKLRDACVIDRHYGKSVTLTLDYDDYMEAADEIERLRAGIGATLLEREDVRAEVERLRAGGCARDQGTTQYCAEAAKLAAEIERLREWNAEIALNAREFAADNERLRAALESVMIGGNHLATIIGATHPQAGVHHEAALQFYGPGHQYDAWCCWNAIMQARAALEAAHDR